jgi:hypothetical protein
MNSLNRSMGLKDSYPFVINETVKMKLDFIHETIRGQEEAANNRKQTGFSLS